MSSSALDAALELRPKPSRQLLTALASMHVLAAVAVLWLLPGIVLPCVLLVLIVLSAAYCRQRYWLGQGKQAIRAALWSAQGLWVLEHNNAQRHRARLLPGSYLHPRLVILQFALLRGGRRYLLLLPDSLDFDTFRRLRLRLRVERQAAVEQGDGARG